MQNNKVEKRMKCAMRIAHYCLWHRWLWARGYAVCAKQTIKTIKFEHVNRRKSQRLLRVLCAGKIDCANAHVWLRHRGVMTQPNSEAAIALYRHMGALQAATKVVICLRFAIVVRQLHPSVVTLRLSPSIHSNSDTRHLSTKVWFYSSNTLARQMQFKWCIAAAAQTLNHRFSCWGSVGCSATVFE